MCRRIGGVIFNRAASPRHAAIAAAALRRALPDLRILGTVPRDPALTLPSRHLGLVPANEQPALERFLDRAAAVMGEAIDMAALRTLATPSRLQREAAPPPLPPLGARIAIARDDAFLFTYGGIVDGWRAQGAGIAFFAPLADEAPPRDADAIYLPGGYPELHAGKLAGHRRFLDGLRAAAKSGAVIYGECGGYMVLGQGLVDATGTRHAMAGLLPLETSFAARRLHLGYREVRLARDGVLGLTGQAYRAHEFHYAAVTQESEAAPLFSAIDADGVALGSAGCVAGTVQGSFIHLIDRV